MQLKKGLREIKVIQLKAGLKEIKLTQMSPEFYK